MLCQTGQFKKGSGAAFRQKMPKNLDDGSMEVESCGVNLSNPVIRNFVESF
jgi:hypothetical protein